MLKGKSGRRQWIRNWVPSPENRFFSSLVVLPPHGAEHLSRTLKRTQKKGSEILQHSKDTPLLMNALKSSNMAQDNQDTKMWQTTRKQSLAETSGVGNGAVHRCWASGQEGGIHCLIVLEPQRGFLGCWTPSARTRKGKGRQLHPLERSRVFNSTSWKVCYLCLLEPGDVISWDMMPVANKSKHNTQHTQREVGLGWERALQLNRVGQLPWGESTWSHIPLLKKQTEEDAKQRDSSWQALWNTEAEGCEFYKDNTHCGLCRQSSMGDPPGPQQKQC